MRKNKAQRFVTCVAILTFVVLTSLSCSESESSTTFEQILSVIPDTPDTREWVALSDYTQLREDFQISALESNTTVEQEKLYLREILKHPDETGRPIPAVVTCPGLFDHAGYFEYSMEQLHNLGLGFWSIEQEVEAGHPPDIIDILKGHFNPENTWQTLAVSAKDDPPSTETYGGNTIFCWGKDHEINLIKRLTPPVYDYLGRGGRFVIQNDYVFRSFTTAGIKLLLDTQNDEHTSLFDVSEYRLMARELSSQGAIAAILSNQTQNLDDVRRRLTEQYDIQQVDDLLAQEPRLVRYETIALGYAKDDKGFYSLIILVHENSQAAAKNVSLLSQRIEETNSLYGSPWASMISSSSISSDGRVLTAKLYGNISRNWLNWYYLPDPLVLHE